LEPRGLACWLFVLLLFLFILLFIKLLLLLLLWLLLLFVGVVLLSLPGWCIRPFAFWLWNTSLAHLQLALSQPFEDKTHAWLLLLACFAILIIMIIRLVIWFFVIIWYFLANNFGAKLVKWNPLVGLI
jgi:hypothetical protein